MSRTDGAHHCHTLFIRQNHEIINNFFTFIFILVFYVCHENGKKKKIRWNNFDKVNAVELSFLTNHQFNWLPPCKISDGKLHIITSNDPLAAISSDAFFFSNKIVILTISFPFFYPISSGFFFACIKSISSPCNAWFTRYSILCDIPQFTINVTI